MNRAVFLDSGILVAFLNRRDQWHPRAVSLFEGAQPLRWFISVFVVSEAYSWFLHRMGEEQARKFRLLVQNLSGIRVLRPSAGHDKDVGKMLDRFRGSKLTYVDASSLCFMEQHAIRRVWSTDHHLGLTGAEVFPRG